MNFAVGNFILQFPQDGNGEDKEYDQQQKEKEYIEEVQMSPPKLQKHFSNQEPESKNQIQKQIQFVRRRSMNNKTEDQDFLRKWLRNELFQLDFLPYDIRKVSSSVQIEEKDYEQKHNLLNRTIEILLEFQIDPSQRLKYQKEDIMARKIQALQAYDDYIDDYKFDFDKNSNNNFNNQNRGISLNDIFIQNIRRSIEANLSQREGDQYSHYIEYKEDSKQDMEQELCKICYSGIKKDKQIKFHSDCESQICKLCLNDYLKSCFVPSNILNIKCPFLCQNNIEKEEIEQLVSDDQELSDKYKKFYRYALIQKNPNLTWCIGPGCENILETSVFDKKLTCQKCQTTFCNKCHRLWHAGQQCSEVLEEEYQQIKLKLEIKTCNQCNSPIEKNQGCNHMTCWKCNYQFCWICDKKYTYKHYQAYNVCGCPSMQYGKFTQADKKKKRVEACQVLAWKSTKQFLELIGGLLLGVIIAALVALGIVFFPSIFFIRYIKDIHYWENHCIGRSLRRTQAMWGLIFILSLFAYPFSLLYMIFVVPYRQCKHMSVY